MLRKSNIRKVSLLVSDVDFVGIYALPSVFRFLIFPGPVSPDHRLKICRFSVNSMRKKGGYMAFLGFISKGGFLFSLGHGREHAFCTYIIGNILETITNFICSIILMNLRYT